MNTRTTLFSTRGKCLVNSFHIEGHEELLNTTSARAVNAASAKCFCRIYALLPGLGKQTALDVDARM
jgi:hypothetical protein